MHHLSYQLSQTLLFRRLQFQHAAVTRPDSVSVWLGSDMNRSCWFCEAIVLMLLQVTEAQQMSRISSLPKTQDLHLDEKLQEQWTR